MAQYVYGKNVVFNILNENKKVNAIYVLASNQELQKQLTKRKVSYQLVSKKELDQLSNHGLHQGIIAKIDDYKTYDISEIINQQHQLIVLLDGIEDPHNLGAILRSCDAIGVDGVIIAKQRSASLNPTVAKVSVGAIERVKVCEVTNLSQTIEKLKKVGYWIVGTDVQDSKDYRLITADVPLVIVIGNEGKGISKLVAKNCDYMVHIPMIGKVQSLNASVSCALMLYNIYNLRNPLK